MSTVRPVTRKLKKDIEEWLSELLSGYEPKRIRDKKVIRDALWEFSRYSQYEINIIDSPLLQRLRRIHQTSLASLTYPNCTHSRFEHSLGVMSIADKMMRSVNEKKETKAYEPLDIASVLEISSLCLPD